jgi:hypothetical protein
MRCPSARPFAVALFALGGLTLSCVEPTGSGNVVESVTVFPPVLGLVLGQPPVLVTATVVGTRGPVTSPSVVWTSDNHSAVTVSGSGEIGTVAAVGAGSATVTATSGGKSASTTIEVSLPFPTITVVATDADAHEAGTNPGAFTISRTGLTTVALTVNLTMSGSATNGTDYALVASTVSIPVGQSAAVVAITPVVDALVEGTESAVITLMPGAYTIGSPGAATVLIADDPPTVTVVATDAAASEGTLDAGIFTVTRTGPTAAALTVSFTLSGTATNGSDYTTIGSSVTILASQSSATVTVTPVADLEVEGAEAVVLTLAAGAYAIGTPSAATIDIEDDPLTITVVASDPDASEVDLDIGMFTVTRTGPFTSAFVVSFELSGTATRGVDYTAELFVTIPVGFSSAIVTITPLADAEVEGDETVILTLVPAGYAIGIPGEATLVISDDALMVGVETSDARGPRVTKSSLASETTPQSILHGQFAGAPESGSARKYWRHSRFPAEP